MSQVSPFAPRSRAARICGARGIFPVLALAGALLSSCCACGPRAQAVAEATLDSPRATVEAFGAYLRAGLHEFEYRCFSADFCRRNQISYFSYAEEREELARRQPWLELFASPTVVADIPRGADRHDVDVRLGGRTYRVNLVREETFRISTSDGALIEDRLDFERRVLAREAANASTELVARLPVPAADIDLSAVTSISLQRRWKIDGVGPLDSPN